MTGDSDNMVSHRRIQSKFVHYIDCIILCSAYTKYRSAGLPFLPRQEPARLPPQ